MRKKKSIMLVVAAGVAWCCLAAAAPREYSGVLEEPVVLGAWLYRGTCARCHGDYGSSRLARNHDSEEETLQAISGDGCEIDWSSPGEDGLRRQELEGAVCFMVKWEALGREPDLPALPDLPQGPGTGPPVQDEKAPPAAQEDEPEQLPEEILHLLSNNPIARGGWLYTTNCYRCHLGYEKARLGKGMKLEAVRQVISEGKTSTQMKPFSAMLGGTLKGAEIGSIARYILAWEEKGEPLAIASVLMTPPALDPADFVPLRLTRFRPVSGDPARGEVLYRISCARCHGGLGQGHVGPALRGEKPVLRPDLFFKSILKQGIPGSLMAAWDTGRGGRYTARDIDDLVSHLTTLEQLPEAGLAIRPAPADGASVAAVP